MTENTAPEEPQPEEMPALENKKPKVSYPGLGSCGENMTTASFCVAVGKCSGNAYRAIIEKSDWLKHRVGGVTKAVSDEAHMLRLRLGNLFKTVKKDTQLTHWEMKRRDDFARLGEELYRRKESELEQLIPEEGFRGILAQVREDEEHIRKIENEKTTQHRRMRDATVFGHATTQITNPDPRIRRAALRVLVRLGNTEAIAKIMPLLKDPDAEVREKARDAIQSLSNFEEQGPQGGEKSGEGHTEEQDHEQPGEGTEPDSRPGEEPGGRPGTKQNGQPATNHPEQPKEEHHE